MSGPSQGLIKVLSRSWHNLFTVWSEHCHVLIVVLSGFGQVWSKSCHDCFTMRSGPCQGLVTVLSGSCHTVLSGHCHGLSRSCRGLVIIWSVHCHGLVTVLSCSCPGLVMSCHGFVQTRNVSQASQACLCKVFWGGVKFYHKHTLFCLKSVFLCVQDFDTTITVIFRQKQLFQKNCIILIPYPRVKYLG